MNSGGAGRWKEIGDRLAGKQPKAPISPGLDTEGGLLVFGLPCGLGFLPPSWEAFCPELRFSGTWLPVFLRQRLILPTWTRFIA